MSPNIFKEQKERREAAAADTSLPILRRIGLLTELYFMHKFDVHSQAKYVRQIEDLTRGAG